MFERLSDLYGRVQESRLRLEDLAEQAAALRGRLRADTSLVDSLEKLTQMAGDRAARAVNEPDGEDGHFISDGWEIALINEEGK